MSWTRVPVHPCSRCGCPMRVELGDVCRRHSIRPVNAYAGARSARSVRRTLARMGKVDARPLYVRALEGPFRRGT